MMFTTLAALSLLVSHPAQPSLSIRHHQNLGPNLVVNSEFNGMTGWPTWSREPGAISTSTDTGHNGNSRAVVITQTGQKDWTLSQKQIPAQDTDLLQLSAWMKTAGGSGSISVVAKDAAGKTLEWTLGAVGLSGNTDWQQLSSTITLPEGTASVQFRITGSGTGKTWVDSPMLSKIVTPPAYHTSPVTISGAGLSLQITDHGAMTATTQGGKTWTYRPWSSRYNINSLSTTDNATAQIGGTDLVNNLPFTVQIQVDPQNSEATLTLSGSGAMAQPMTVPGSLVTSNGQWIVLPLNEGVRFPVEETEINGWTLPTYEGNHLSMPWSGIYDPSTGAEEMTVIETPDDADIAYHQESGHMTFLTEWEGTKKNLGYSRKLLLSFADQGGYVSMAKRYRSYVQSTGAFKTLTQKKAENPNIDLLVGSVNVWNKDMNQVALCQEMKQMGMDRVLYSHASGADNVRQIAAMGYLPGTYDLYLDIFNPQNARPSLFTKGWPDDLILGPDGDWVKGWTQVDKQPDGSKRSYRAGEMCSIPALAHAKEKIPANIAQVPYLARFLDTTGAATLMECYNPKHPTTRTEDKTNKIALLSFTSGDMKLVTGTETTNDFAVPYVAYSEGLMSILPYRLPESGNFPEEYRAPTPKFQKYQMGPNYRLPLFDLVYHDCLISQWYWGDGSNKTPEVWDQRDLFNILYGSGPLLFFENTRWQRDKARMMQTYNNVCKWTRLIGYDEMTSFEDLTPDKLVQKSTWSSGHSVIVNFGSQPYHGIAPNSYAIDPTN